MNILPGYAIKIIPSDFGTMIALDRDVIDSDVSIAIQEDQTDFLQGIDFRCDVFENSVIVNKGRVRIPSSSPDASYGDEVILETTLLGFIPNEEGDIFIESQVSEDPISAAPNAGGVATFGSNQYNYAAGLSEKSRFVFSSIVTKGVMPPSTMDYICVRLAEYSVDEDGVISLTQTHLGPITVPKPIQNNDFAIFFRIV